MRSYYIKHILEAGIDEAGRGPLFGRVYAAAVILNPDLTYNEKLVKDSKKLSNWLNKCTILTSDGKVYHNMKEIYCNQILNNL